MNDVDVDDDDGGEDNDAEDNHSCGSDTDDAGCRCFW